MSRISRLATFAIAAALFTGSSTTATAAAPTCTESWIFSYTVDFHPGDWTVGQHSYDLNTSVDGTTEFFHRTFTVDPTAPLVRGQARLGPQFRPLSIVGPLNAISPAQDTFMQIIFVFDRASHSHVETSAIADASWALFRWDGGAWVTPERSPVVPSCSIDNDGFWLRKQGAGEREPNAVTLVSSLPFTGAQGFHAKAVENGIRMALEEADWRVGGTRITYVSLDDGSATHVPPFDATKEIANAQTAASDASVVAWLGPFNSGAAKRSIPILCEAGLVMVSPSNTYNGLTKAAPFNELPDEPQRYYPNGCARNYSRVAIRDPQEGELAAVLARSLGGSTAYVIRTGNYYPRSIAAGFSQRATLLGIAVVGEEEVAPNAASYTALAGRVASSGADTVFVSTTANEPAGGAIVRDVRAAAPAARIIGGDQFLFDPNFVLRAGAAADGAYALSEAWAPENYTGASTDWRTRYERQFGPVMSPYALYGYEATNAVLAALRRAGADPTRTAVRTAVMGTGDFEGLLGTWSFDTDGDTSASLVSYARFANGRWTFVGTISLP